MDLPTGTVTFFFTDIEGSTGLLHALGHESYGRLQDEHSVIMRGAIDQGSGVEIRTEGDAFFAVFGSPAGAVLAATEAQKGLAAYAWPDGSEIRVRIGMHTGEGSLGGDDYLGIDVNRAARIAAVGHGGQVVVSAATAGLVEQSLPDGRGPARPGASPSQGFPRSRCGSTIRDPRLALRLRAAPDARRTPHQPAHRTDLVRGARR